MEKWNDYQNERIARLPYDIKGKTYNAGNNQALYVKKVINTESNGGTAYVTVPSNEKNFSPNKVRNVEVIYRGSDAPVNNNGKKDWFQNDVPMATKIGGAPGGLTPQLKSSANDLNNVMKQYPNAKFRVYGHSLGCMDLQAAVAGCKYPQRIEAAYGYEGPNIYEKLPLEQQVQVNEMKNKINLYADEEDMVAVGYANHEHMGNLYAVHSSNKYLEAKSSILKTFGVAGNFIVHEHMFGGYQFDKKR